MEIRPKSEHQATRVDDDIPLGMHLPGWTPSASFVRAAPFVAYIAILALTPLIASLAPPASAAIQWLHPLKGLLAGVLLLWFWGRYDELREKSGLKASFALAGVALGTIVFVLWVSLDAPWMMWGSGPEFDPDSAKSGSTDGLLLAGRLLGLVVVVPIMEELFWRSFLMRWLTRHDFQQVDPRTIRSFAFWATALLFAAEHHLWLAGLLAGIAFNALYMWTRNLWIPILAHMVANACLGAYILAYARWDLW